MTQEEKAKAYDEALERARIWQNHLYDINDRDYADELNYIFQELIESKDEKIRKELIKIVKVNFPYAERYIAWLEKQGSEPNWCHHKVDLSNCSEEYCKAYYDGWNNCNMQHSQCKSELDDVVKCLINGMKFYYEDNEEATWGTDKWSMPVKHIIEVLEKQGEHKPTLDFKAKDWYISKVDGKIHNMTYNPADKVEPKFKVGDWITNGDYTWKIVEVKPLDYILQAQDGNIVDDTISHVDEQFHSFTIEDAKDGDVLACGDKITDCPFIFHNLTDELNPRSYCGINRLQHFQDNDENGGFWCCSDEVRPATKEQRDTLMRVMIDAGWEFDFEKKELKKIEQKPAWSEEDEKTALGIEQVMICASFLNIVPDKIERIRTWLKSLKERLS